MSKKKNFSRYGVEYIAAERRIANKKGDFYKNAAITSGLFEENSPLYEGVTDNATEAGSDYKMIYPEGKTFNSQSS